MSERERFTRAAMSFEGVSTAPHMDRTAFRARLIFATLAADGNTANLLLTPDDQQMKQLLAPEAFAPVKGGWGAMGWTTVRLAVLSDAELHDALRLAHARGAAPLKRNPDAERPELRAPRSPRNALEQFSTPLRA